jgi:hypothetical protein
MPREPDDLFAHVLAHLHANSRLSTGELAGAVGAPEDEVAAAIDTLLGRGDLERQGDRLIPGAASHPTPGLFVPSERADAEAGEADYGDD